MVLQLQWSLMLCNTVDKYSLLAVASAGPGMNDHVHMVTVTQRCDLMAHSQAGNSSSLGVTVFPPQLELCLGNACHHKVCSELRPLRSNGANGGTCTIPQHNMYKQNRHQ
jgi:hypothetical protein